MSTPIIADPWLSSFLENLASNENGTIQTQVVTNLNAVGANNVIAGPVTNETNQVNVTDQSAAAGPDYLYEYDYGGGAVAFNDNGTIQTQVVTNLNGVGSGNVILGPVTNETNQINATEQDSFAL